MRGTSAILIAAWIACAGWGLVKMLNYEFTPATIKAAAQRWPETTLVHDVAQPTLVVFLHPRCPCSRATLEEVKRLVADCGSRLALRIIFIKPPDTPEGWERTGLYASAEQIPKATVLLDMDGTEAARFGATTSGEALLYAPDGALLFRGGLTAARGHEGDNAGRAALRSLALTGQAALRQTPVFGCPLHNNSNE